MSKLKEAVEDNVRWVKKEQEEAAANAVSRLDEADGNEGEVGKLIREYLPAAELQAEQIKEWFKVPDSWAYESLLKIYGEDYEKVNQQIALMIFGPVRLRA